MSHQAEKTKLFWFHDTSFNRTMTFLLMSLTAIAIVVFAAGASSQPDSATVADDAGKSNSTHLLSAASRWDKTGIIIPPKGSVKIEASGKVHLSFHHLVSSAISDFQPPFGWVGPDGDEYRGDKELLVGKEANIGCLLAALHSPENAETAEPSIDKNPRPKKLFKIGSKGTVYNDQDCPMELWLIVNDEFLNPNDKSIAKQQYLDSASYHYAKSEGTDEDHWKYILENKYWDIWYDDNMGNYLVTINK